MQNIAQTLHTNLVNELFDVYDHNDLPPNDMLLVEKVCELLNIRYDSCHANKVVLTSPLDTPDIINPKGDIRTKLRLDVGTKLVEILSKFKME